MRRVTRDGTDGAGAASSLFAGDAFHMTRSAPSVGAASAALVTAAVVVTAAGAAVSPVVASAFAMAGRPAERMQTNNPVRMERRKNCSFFHTYGVS
jgi:C4-dicarboxylate transporter